MRNRRTGARPAFQPSDLPESRNSATDPEIPRCGIKGPALRPAFQPREFAEPAHFHLGMLPYCFIMRRMSAYCFST